MALIKGKSIPARLFFLLAFAAIVYGILLLRLWDEQIRHGKKHREKIRRQSVRRIRIPGIRGRIFTSDMRALADNIPSYELVFHLAEMRVPGSRSRTINHILETITKLGQAIGRKNDITEKDIIEHINLKPALPLAVFSNLGVRELATVAEMITSIKGAAIEVLPVRNYPEKDMASHIIGYVGFEDPAGTPDREDFFYYIPDMTGRNGLEKAFDNIIPETPQLIRGLRGKPGSRLVRVDHRGYVFEEISLPLPPLHGNDVISTIDFTAQKTAESLLEEKTGAFVLLDAENGEVLAMVSKPSYKLQNFVPKLSSSYWNSLLEDPARPLVNRACFGEYTPGSIIKPLVALALLENGIDPDHTTMCTGASYIGNRPIRCWIWRYGGHGNLNIREAIEQSCNVYFVENGQETGLEKIAEMMYSAGLGKKTGLPIPEKSGLVPDRRKKRQRLNEQWTKFDTALISMGQGFINVTPVQAAVYSAAIANGGTLWRPRLLKSVKEPMGVTIFRSVPKTTGKLAATPRSIDIVRQGMHAVVHGEKGSGKRADNPYIELFGKTGTAELGPKDKRRKNTAFIGFGRHENRLYAFSIFIENGESGGRTCAPIAAEFFEKWLGNTR